MTTKTEKIVKAYQDYLDNPFADVYTVCALEARFHMDIEEMAKIYNDNRNKTVLTDKELLKEISKVIKTENGYLQYDTAIRKIRELLQDNGY